MTALELLLRIAGLLHFAVLTASALVPGVLDWRRELAKVHPFLRRLFWVYGGFIVLTIVGFGTLTLFSARTMAEGEFTARLLCAFVAVFWAARLAVQLFVFDARPFLTNLFLKAGYHLLTFVFVYFAAIYGWAAVR